jgi:hypothetical protein
VTSLVRFGFLVQPDIRDQLRALARKEGVDVRFLMYVALTKIGVSIASHDFPLRSRRRSLKTKQLNLAISAESKDELRSLADKTGLPMANIVEAALRQYFALKN